MVDEFETLRDAYRYIGRFEHLYAGSYPSEELTAWYKRRLQAVESFLGTYTGEPHRQDRYEHIRHTERDHRSARHCTTAVIRRPASKSEGGNMFGKQEECRLSREEIDRRVTYLMNRINLKKKLHLRNRH